MRLPVLLLSLCLPFLATTEEGFSCEKVPPSLWCQNAGLAKQCGFNTLCNRYEKSTYDQPVLLTLLYESLCPGCQQFITQQLYPIIFKNFPPEVVKIELVPFGNARYVNGTLKCQHGEPECTINMFESCLLVALPEQTSFMPVIYCLETELKARTEFVDAVEKCFSSLNVTQDTQTMIQSCIVTTEGNRLQEKAGKRTAGVQPEKHDHVPWLLFNNVSLGSAQLLLESVPTMLCEWYSGRVRLPFCGIAKTNSRTSSCAV